LGATKSRHPESATRLVGIRALFGACPVAVRSDNERRRDLTGTISDSYDYDGFGNLINSTGTTPNNYLFAGEQYDPALNLYYNRARYYNNSTGRFINMDEYEGDPGSPASLHKYLYAEADPVNHVDISGHDFDFGSTLAASAG
jgi:RHS repeat-associated protein